ncbi:MAG: class B sortase [Bacilli bacterium]|nr:class B sortase [Bacilli bacterium]
MKKRKIKKSVKRFIATIFFLITISTIIFCLFKIVVWANDNKKTKEITNDINEQVTITTTEQEIIDIVDPETPKEDPVWSYDASLVKNVDLSKLYQINNETVGWIIMENTKINYPVVQHEDNDYYLNRSFDKSINGAGWVFMDYRNNTEDIDKNTIIYAHGRMDSTMFGSLRKTLKESWYDNPENYIINYSTEQYNSLWQIFSLYKIPTTSDYLQIDFNSDEEYLNWLNMLKDRSIYDFKTNVSSDNKIITLSTCYNDDEKLVVHAKLIKLQNKTEN